MFLSLYINIAQGMESVLRTLDGFPKGFSTFVGIIRVRIPSLAVIDTDSINSSQTPGVLEWIPGVSVTFSDQTLVYSSNAKVSDPVCYFDDNVTFDLPLNVTAVPSSKIILRYLVVGLFSVIMKAIPFSVLSSLMFLV